MNIHLSQAVHKRQAAALYWNVEYFINTVGLDRVGVAGFTFARVSPNPREALACLRKLLRKTSHLFGHYMWVLVFDRTLRIHVHALVACDADIRSGYSNTIYAFVKTLQAQARAERRALTTQERAFMLRLKKAETSNPVLKKLRSELRPFLRSCSFGDLVELAPVRTTPQHTAGYFEKNFKQAVLGRLNLGYKGVHIHGRSKDAPRKASSQFAAVKSKSRFVYKAIAEACGLDEDQRTMKRIFGSKWAYFMRPAIGDLEIQFGRDPGCWPQPAILQAIGICFPKEYERLPVFFNGMAGRT